VDPVPYFAYGTTQRGFAHHRQLAKLLGKPAGRFRTVAPHAVVVPHEAACSNPGCEYLHRMAVLVAGFDPLRAEGDLFLISDAALEVIDRLETVGPYVRREIEIVALDGARTRAAQAYVAADAPAWEALVARGRAAALAAYPRELASGEERKPCCVRAPGHPPPHDVIDPL
jgi:gamma-glutamylcyclotransferase (GGCT)/AIG2-like uncharacterized protein YtfP